MYSAQISFNQVNKRDDTSSNFYLNLGRATAKLDRNFHILFCKYYFDNDFRCCYFFML